MSTQEKTMGAKAQDSNTAEETSAISKPEDKGSNPPASEDAIISAVSEGSDNSEVVLLTKDIPVTDLLKLRSPKIASLLEDIGKYKSVKAFLRKELRAKKKMLEHIPRNIKKLKGAKAIILLPEERKVIPIEVAHLEAQLLQVNEHLELAYEKLRSLTKSESARLAIQELYDKANSQMYTKRNKYFIQTNLLEILNAVLSGDNIELKDLFTQVRQAAFKLDEDGNKEFKELLAELLREADVKTYILTSGKLKAELYEAVKLTLQQYQLKDLSIEKLIFPEDLVKEVDVFVDPLIKNKGLISSLIIRFLNESIGDKNKVKILREIAKLSKEKDTTPFFSKLDDFIYEGSEDIYVLCTGDVKERL